MFFIGDRPLTRLKQFLRPIGHGFFLFCIHKYLQTFWPIRIAKLFAVIMNDDYYVRWSSLLVLIQQSGKPSTNQNRQQVYEKGWSMLLHCCSARCGIGLECGHAPPPSSVVKLVKTSTLVSRRSEVRIPLKNACNLFHHRGLREHWVYGAYEFTSDRARNSQFKCPQYSEMNTQTCTV